MNCSETRHGPDGRPSVCSRSPYVLFVCLHGQGSHPSRTFCRKPADGIPPHSEPCRVRRRSSTCSCSSLSLPVSYSTRWGTLHRSVVWSGDACGSMHQLVCPSLIHSSEAVLTYGFTNHLNYIPGFDELGVSPFYEGMPASAKLSAIGFMIFGCGVEIAGITVSRGIVKWFKGTRDGSCHGFGDKLSPASVSPPV